MTTTMRRLGASAVLALACMRPRHAAPPDTVFLEELTWPELRDAQRAGKTTVIIRSAVPSRAARNSRSASTTCACGGSRNASRRRSATRSSRRS
jgi:hypothetical protein